MRFALQWENLVDNGGCYFNEEIKNWLIFRQSLCRESDGLGLGWVYELANVLSAYLQTAVAEMSNKEREAGEVATDCAKFSEAQLKKVAKALGKSQGSFLLKQVLIKHRKDTFGSNRGSTWTMPNEDTPTRKISSKLMNNVISRTLSRATVSSLSSFMMPSTPKDPSSQKLLPRCKV